MRLTELTGNEVITEENIIHVYEEFSDDLVALIRSELSAPLKRGIDSIKADVAEKFARKLHAWALQELPAARKIGGDRLDAIQKYVNNSEEFVTRLVDTACKRHVNGDDELKRTEIPDDEWAVAK